MARMVRHLVKPAAQQMAVTRRGGRMKRRG
jgi:hypothetical protein